MDTNKTLVGDEVTSLLLVLQAGEGVRTYRFQARTPAEAKRWQSEARQQLFRMMMGGAEPLLVGGCMTRGWFEGGVLHCFIYCLTPRGALVYK